MEKVVNWVTLFVICIMAATFMITLKPSSQILTGNVIFPSIPSDCNETTIRALWDSLFKESSINTTIHTDNLLVGNQCNKYFVSKEVNGENYFLIGFINQAEGNSSYIYATYGNFTQSFSSKITAIQNISDANFLFPQNNILPYENSAFIESSVNTRFQSITSSNVNATFVNIFEDFPTSWFSTIFFNNYLYYKYSNTLINSSINITSFGEMFSNYNYNKFIYQKKYLTQACTSNWTAFNTSCQPTDTYTVYYQNQNNCQNSSAPANITNYCDYDNNGIIGNLSSFKQLNLNLNLYIDLLPANISQKYNLTKRVEFKEGTLTRIEFDWNFASSLNLNLISIEKQNSTSQFGYLLIKNLSVIKNLILDKINALSSQVCVKNQELDQINNISANCNGQSEYRISCPGTSSGFSCIINGTKYKVSGLTNSAVREIQINQTNQTICNPNWQCAQFSQCINNVQSRICTDLNRCNITTGKPAETQTCISPPQCIANWNCTSWTPERCKQNQTITRTCLDLNKCKTTIGKPIETTICENPVSTFAAAKVILAIIIITIVTLIALVSYYLIKKSNKGFDIESENHTPTYQYHHQSSQEKSPFD